MPLSAGVKLAITAGMMVAQVALTASQKIKGPRLDDLEVSLSEYGTPIPRFWGIRRLQPQIMWAEKLREKKETSKTKGGKYSEYKYFGTWAALICDNEIESVSRIWMDKHLVYDVTGAGPITGASVLYSAIDAAVNNAVKLMRGANMRIYPGTETQEPDPRMEAWCEDRYGPDSCPAYRGSAYIVFEELPLEKFGNRIPQLTVEVISAADVNFVYETKTPVKGFTSSMFSPDFSRFVARDGDGYEVWDVASRTKVLSSDVEWSGHFGLGAGGDIYGVTAFPSNFLLKITPTGQVSTIASVFEEFSSGCQYVGGVICVLPYQGLIEVLMQFGRDNEVFASPTDFFTTNYFEDIDGVAWACGNVDAAPGAGFCLVSSEGGDIAATGETGTVYGMDNGEGQFLIEQSNKLFLIDKATFAVTAGPVAANPGTDDWLPFHSVRPGAPTIWIGSVEYSTADLSILRTIDYADWVVEAVTDSIYEPVNHALWCKDASGDDMTIRYLDRVASNGVTLSDVVDDVADWCGLTGHDSTALTQTVLGYSVTQGTGKDMVAPLLELHDADARPHDFSIQFVNRGSAPSGTILTADFVREGDEARYTASIAQDTDLPKRVTYNFADANSDQQTNTVIAQRGFASTDSSREETIDLSTYVDTPDAAQKKADRHFRRIWNSRETIQFGLTAQKLVLEPADVTTISLDGVTRSVRLDKMTIQGSSVACEFIRDEAIFATLNDSSGPDMEGRDPEVIYVPALTNGFIIDGPLVEDADNDINPIIYYAAGPYAGTWPGAVVFRGDDGTYDEAFGAVDSSSGATWGFANTELATANPNLWDRGNTLNVTLFNGPLTSVTEAAIDADPLLNMVAIGADGRWEYVQFATATLEGDGTYTLSKLKRGRRGTEWAVGLHEIGDQFVMLNDVSNVEMGTDDIGDAISFKVQSVGRSIDAAYANDLTYTAASLKPYAPAIQSVTKDAASGDITVDFDRRTRIGGNWNGSTIPLGEAAEAYELDVLDGSDVARTLTATTSEVVYTAADQTTDFGAPITAAALDAMLYQMSATVGRGFAAAI